MDGIKGLPPPLGWDVCAREPVASLRSTTEAAEGNRGGRWAGEQATEL